MKDKVHTNKQRIEKVRSVFTAINNFNETAKAVYIDSPFQSLSSAMLDSLDQAAKEAEASLAALESFLDERNALDRID